MTQEILHPQGAVLDLHCHTVMGSGDSQLTLRRLAAAAQKRQLTACCVTEHDHVWSEHDALYFSGCIGTTFVRGIEVTTNLGHVIAYGLDRFTPEMADAEFLRKEVSAAGGVMIAAHPFRSTLTGALSEETQPMYRSIQDAAKAPLFSLVDEVEVLNGGTEPLENFLALCVARQLGFRGVGGSDAHSDDRVGKYVTLFDHPVTTVPDLIRELRAGRFSAAQSDAVAGPTLSRYTWEAASPALEPQLQAALARSGKR